MDRPHNLMHVNGLIGFDRLPDVGVLTELVMSRMVRKYRVLSQVPVEREGRWFWEDDPHFSIERHVRRVALEDAGEEAVRAHVSEQFSAPLDRTRPLWEMHLLCGPDDHPGGWVYGRFHHGLGDGVRLVQMLIGTCDPVEGATPPAVGRNVDAEHHHPLERMLHAVGRSVTDTLDYVGNAGEAVASAARTVVSTTNPLRLVDRVGDAVELARHPARLVDALESIGSTDNELSNSWGEIGRMLLSDGHDARAWSGTPGVDKAVAWTEGLPLDDVRAAVRGRDATVNDVLVAAVSLALTDYLEERGVSDVDDLSWMMPMSLQPIDGRLPPRLGNHFVVVMLSMPLGIRGTDELLAEVHARTTRLKHSAEPLVSFGVQQAIARSPSAVARRVTDFFSGKTIGQLSNVPGPRVAMSMAGVPVRSILGWVPTSGDQPLGICLFSHDDRVNVGVATDRRMIPDPEHLAGLVERHLAGLATNADAADAAR